MALHKDPTQPQKLRPIGIGSAIRRLLGRHITTALRPQIAAHLLPEQYGIGISGGLDFIVTHLLATLEDTELLPPTHPDRRAIIQLDFQNMFNTVHRDTVRAELTEHLPQLVQLFDNLYPPDGNQVWLRTASGHWESFHQLEGFAQGCPLSPLFSCLPLAKLLRQLMEYIQDLALTPLSYLDDTHLLPKLSQIRPVFEYLQAQGPQYGLILSPDKCNIILSSTTDILPLLPLPLQQDLQWVLDNYCKHHQSQGLRVLGHPIGNSDFAVSYLHSKLDHTQHLTDLLLKHVQSPAIKLRLFLIALQAQLPFHYATTLRLQPSHLQPLLHKAKLLLQNFLMKLTNQQSLPPPPQLATRYPTYPHGRFGIPGPKHLGYTQLHPSYRTHFTLYHQRHPHSYSLLYPHYRRPTSPLPTTQLLQITICQLASVNQHLMDLFPTTHP
jgi:hypothetical protein